ncbi:hypothetical protein HG530_001881 [Fusarium avenaceum]|nr:hypothetical protein HG530_001881 [Fusarium avenaceum]
MISASREISSACRGDAVRDDAFVFLRLAVVLVVTLAVSFVTEEPFARLAATSPTLVARSDARFWGVREYVWMTRFVVVFLRSAPVETRRFAGDFEPSAAFLAVVVTVLTLFLRAVAAPFATFEPAFEIVLFTPFAGCILRFFALLPLSPALDNILEIRLGLLNFARLGTKNAAAVRLAAKAPLHILRRERVKVIIIGPFAAVRKRSI